MADDRSEARSLSWNQLVPWTEIFRGFKLAIDPSKFLLAAAGIAVMAGGWWLLSVVFGAAYSNDAPHWERDKYRSNAGDDPAAIDRAWKTFKDDRDRWNLMHRASGLGENQVVEPADLAQSPEQLEQIDTAQKQVGTDPSRSELETALVGQGFDRAQARDLAYQLGQPKRGGSLASSPWSEYRGPNPFLLVTGQAGVPWEAGHFWDWFFKDQALVLIEPLVKLFTPIVYYFNKQADAFLRFYFFCVMLWTVATWAVFGGAITRIAAVQVARNERIGMMDALRYTLRRIQSYLIAPLVPLAIVLILLLLMIVFGFFHMIPVFGDIVVSGLFWWLIVFLGMVMACFVISLLGWPVMVNTVSAEGTDSWEAVTRGLTYVFQRPWQYAWYSLVAIAYGAVIVFVVGFLGSFMVYLGKWGVTQTPFIERADRDPAFLFVYSPKSFGWRTLLLEGATVEGERVVQHGEVDEVAYEKYVNGNTPDSLRWWNKFGAVMVTVWIGLVFLIVLGFGYSYFWCASTLIYMLLRRTVDAQEMDEVYMPEEDEIAPYSSPVTPPSVDTPPQSGPTMVETPTLRTPPPATPSTPPASELSTTEAPASEPAPPPASEPSASEPATSDSASSEPAASEPASSESESSEPQATEASTPDASTSDAESEEKDESEEKKDEPSA